MRTKKTVTKEVQEEDRAYCNRCGVEDNSKSVMCKSPMENFYVSIQDSQEPDEVNMYMDYSFDLCDSCIYWLMGHFVIPAERR